MIYFIQICITDQLLVSNGKISCDLISVCSDDSHESVHTLISTHMN